jgi:hypothetical protein
VGAASAIYVFHHDRYLNCLALPFRRLIATGELDPWLAELWRLKDSRFARVRRDGPPPFPFASRPMGSNRARLTAELTVSDESTPHVLCWDDRGELEQLQYLFEFAVLRYCLDEKQWTGNANRPQLILASFSDADGPDPQPALMQLCEDLDRNGSIWTHGSGGFSEGIHGWLSPARTREFLTELSRLTLPSPDLTSAIILEQTGNDFGAYYRLEDGVHLARMRQVAQMAVDAGHGVLWANDVYPCENDPAPARLDPAWLAHADGSAVKIARSIRDEGDFAALPVLADALEEAGCSDDEILLHCRQPGEHLWCCWVVDRVLDTSAL